MSARLVRIVHLFARIAVAGCLALSGLSYTRAQETTLDARLNEQVVMVPGANGNLLETTIFRPPGQGPFPLVVMNHGKQPGDPRLQSRDRFYYLSREFVRRGYAVIVPMRSGFARSGGDYSDYGCNMAGNGYLQAADLRAALHYARSQPWVDGNRVIVAGQSYGGLATLAAGAGDLPGVRGLLNFAGGLRADDGSCQWKSALVTAFADFGRHNRLPSLWFYGANDSYFNHELVNRLHRAYAGAGGDARLVAYDAFKNDAHGMVGSRDGFAIWWPHAERFLKQLGMPTAEVVAIAEDPPIPRTDFAAIQDIESVPFLRERGREAYRAFLSKATPRAFAVSPSGAWSWAEEGEDPVTRVLSACQANSRQPCRLYAVDDYVVWNESPQVPANMASTGGNAVLDERQPVVSPDLTASLRGR
ncbi:dienelactone hydrolase family protein [Noviherbaspirillum suwonense]|jgi:dienelactone hydrolase|uniref:Dienelactone hydrolase n=1 Tax=Noviherbaspirillum suwonense TaxID=1224511 RepID=A0ABY1PQL9_9BURK|nr:CocE/NonD family hydrolase [Noviherbaspirillum suwonense]SMP42707.1 Dienelactone hydrolase [Noviherbaspirillum suwonense]